MGGGGPMKRFFVPSQKMTKQKFSSDERLFQHYWYKIPVLHIVNYRLIRSSNVNLLVQINQKWVQKSEDRGLKSGYRPCPPRLDHVHTCDGSRKHKKKTINYALNRTCPILTNQDKQQQACCSEVLGVSLIDIQELKPDSGRAAV